MKDPEQRLRDTLLAIAELGKLYVGGVECREKMRKQLELLDEAWAGMAEEIISGGNRE